jgi:hypothetical protein
MNNLPAALANDDWPTLSEELTRKGVQTLDKWMARHAVGKISDRELYLVTDVLHDAVSGLVKEQYLRLLEAVMRDLKKNGRAQKPKAAV